MNTERDSRGAQKVEMEAQGRQGGLQCGSLPASDLCMGPAR